MFKKSWTIISRDINFRLRRKEPKMQILITFAPKMYDFVVLFFVRNACMQPAYWMEAFLSQKWNVKKVNTEQFSEKNPRDHITLFLPSLILEFFRRFSKRSA